MGNWSFLKLPCKRYCDIVFSGNSIKQKSTGRHRHCNTVHRNVDDLFQAVQGPSLEIFGFFGQKNCPWMIFCRSSSKWMFPKMVGFPPKSSILIGFFQYFHHPFWGFSPYFWVNTRPWWWKPPLKRPPSAVIRVRRFRNCCDHLVDPSSRCGEIYISEEKGGCFFLQWSLIPLIPNKQPTDAKKMGLVYYQRIYIHI